ncbi:MAG: hypothetical protein HRT67_03610, partial [Flavobacteriaceae bacterium]|nr:hypothetical protein [Flavobacteriaceae bacterium]
MKKIICIVCLLVLSAQALYSEVGIGLYPDDSTVLKVSHMETSDLFSGITTVQGNEISNLENHLSPFNLVEDVSQLNLAIGSRLNWSPFRGWFSSIEDIMGKSGDWELEVDEILQPVRVYEYNSTSQDTDGDGVNDDVDIDDDNDGVLDTTELNCGIGLAATTTANTVTTVGSQYFEGVFTNNDGKLNYSVDFQNLNTALSAGNI